jgi:hypothetical protein
VKLRCFVVLLLRFAVPGQAPVATYILPTLGLLLYYILLLYYYYSIILYISIVPLFRIHVHVRNAIIIDNVVTIIVAPLCCFPGWRRAPRSALRAPRSALRATTQANFLLICYYVPATVLALRAPRHEPGEFPAPPLLCTRNCVSAPRPTPRARRSAHTCRATRRMYSALWFNGLATSRLRLQVAAIIHCNYGAKIRSNEATLISLNNRERG